MVAPASESTRVRVAALVVLGGKVVLVRHRAGSSTYHLLPGGGLRYRETLAEAVVREVREETGLAVRVGRPLFINDTIDPRGSRHLVNITFFAEVTGGEITDAPQDDRVEAVELVDPSTLASLDLRPPFADAIAAFLRGESPQTSYLGSLFTEVR